jgi:hypothetical protein
MGDVRLFGALRRAESLWSGKTRLRPSLNATPVDGIIITVIFFRQAPGEGLAKAGIFEMNPATLGGHEHWIRRNTTEPRFKLW